MTWSVKSYCKWEEKKIFSTIITFALSTNYNNSHYIHIIAFMHRGNVKTKKKAILLIEEIGWLNVLASSAIILKLD